MANLPTPIRTAALQAVYARLDELRWETLGNSERTAEYNRMVSDPGIGGRLAPYMDPGKIRVWIKDGPAKEYRRALEGIGPFASFTTRTLGSPDQVVASALGEGWRIEEDSLAEKPMRCIAVDSSGNRKFVIWGALDNLSGLVWHAVRERADRPDSRPLIVVTRPSTTNLSVAEWDLAQRICEVIGVDCTQVVQEVTRKPPVDGQGKIRESQT